MPHRHREGGCCCLNSPTGRCWGGRTLAYMVIEAIYNKNVQSHMRSIIQKWHTLFLLV